MSEKPKPSIDQIQADLSQTIIELGELQSLRDDPLARAQRAVEIGLRRKDLNLQLLQLQLEQKSPGEIKRTRYELQPLKEGVQAALEAFVDEPKVEMGEIQRMLGKMKNGRDYLPQNAYFALKRAVGVLAYRVDDTNVASDGEKEFWQKVKRASGKDNSAEARTEIQSRVYQWFREAKATTPQEKREVERVENFEVEAFTKDEARVLASLLIIKDGVDIDSNGQNLSKFTLPQNIRDICQRLVAEPQAYGNPEAVRASLEVLRKSVIQKVASIIEGERSEEIDKQIPEVAEILTWIYVEGTDELRGYFSRFLSERARQEITPAKGSIVDSTRLLWELPSVGTKQQIGQTEAQSMSVEIQDILDHPLYTRPTYEAEKGQEIPSPDEPKIDYRWIKFQPQMSEFLGSLPPRTSSMIEAFLEDENSAWIFDVIRDFDSDDPEQINEFTQRLSGAIFEQLAYEHVKNEHLKEGQVLLSPKDAFELWHGIYPERQVINHGGLNMGIDGTSFPDGLILRDTPNSIFIVSVDEYKNWTKEVPNRENFRRQLQNYTPEYMNRLVSSVNKQDHLILGRILNRIRPDIPVKRVRLELGYKIEYFFPGNSQVNIDDIRVDMNYVPIQTTDIARFMDVLLKVVKQDSILEQKVAGILEKLPLEVEQEETFQAEPQLPGETTDTPEVTHIQETPAGELEAASAITQPAEEEEADAPEEEIEDQFEASPFVQELPTAKEPSAPKSLLERHDKNYAENIPAAAAEAIKTVAQKGSPLAAFRGKGVYGYLSRGVKNGEDTITREKYAQAIYMTAHFRNSGVPKKIIDEINSRIQQELEKQEKEVQNNSAK